MNEIQIKKAVRAGNSSAVILPRAWLNKEVRVELIKKTPDMILSDVFKIVREHVDLSNIVGIYLVGSYARKEEDQDSDIDILIITHSTDKEMIISGVYNILIVSSSLLKQKLSEDLFPIGQMIIEAKPLLNSSYIESIEVKVNKNNIKWYLSTTNQKLRLIEKIISFSRRKNKKYISDRIAYTLILRIRTLYIIKNLIKGKNYSKKDFIKLINTISNGKDSYGLYQAVKNNLNDKNKLNIKEAEALYNYLKKLLSEIKDKV